MKFSSITIVVGTLAGLALLFAALAFSGTYFLPDLSSGIHDTPQVQTGTLAGARAPYFDLPDLSGTHQVLSAFSNKPLVILFWATWDTQSTDALHIVDEYFAHNSQEANLVSVVAINSQEDKSVVASYIRRGGYETPVLLDTRGLASEAYSAKSLPIFFFVGGDGLVRESYAGVLSENMLGDKIEQLLK